MKPIFPDPCLVDKLLADEAWQEASAQIKARGLSALRVRKIQRRVTGVAAVCAVFALAGLSAWLMIHKPAVIQQAKASEIRQAPASTPKHINDEELLAFFKDRSCVLAEINGKKELVFLDEEPAQDGK